MSPPAFSPELCRVSAAKLASPKPKHPLRVRATAIHLTARARLPETTPHVVRQTSTAQGRIESGKYDRVGSSRIESNSARSVGSTPNRAAADLPRGSGRLGEAPLPFRFPDYDPASRLAPRGMQVLWQNSRQDCREFRQRKVNVHQASCCRHQCPRPREPQNRAPSSSRASRFP